MSNPFDTPPQAPAPAPGGKKPYTKPEIKYEGHVEALAVSCTGRSNKKTGQATCRIQGAFS